MHCKKNNKFLYTSYLFLFLLFFVLIIACNSVFTPKPKGYFKINFPEKKYTTFQMQGYPYSFDYPVYATITKDSLFFGDKTENPWWININFPQFNGRVYVSYKQISKNNFSQLVDDAFKLTGKHTQKATSIDDSVMHTQNGIYGMYFKVGGDVATANQFFLSDSTNHFLRGALYFDATPNEDSLRIINNFLLEDVKHIINTFKFIKPE
jgi:gliding motility-associated lipoprotein GldD